MTAWRLSAAVLAMGGALQVHAQTEWHVAEMSPAEHRECLSARGAEPTHCARILMRCTEVAGRPDLAAALEISWAFQYEAGPLAPDLIAGLSDCLAGEVARSERLFEAHLALLVALEEGHSSSHFSDFYPGEVASARLECAELGPDLMADGMAPDLAGLIGQHCEATGLAYWADAAARDVVAEGADQ